MLFTPTKALFALSTLSLPLVRSQFVSSLPQCVQDCIDQSQDDNCEATDIKCLCRASAGNFLPDLITCMHGNCDNDLDNNLLLTPLQLACTLAGTPIPASAIRNAENEASSLASQGQATTTVIATPTVEAVTLTSTQSGTTIYEIYPITIYGTTTISGPTSTKTISHSISTGPVVITTTNSVGSTYTFWLSHPGTSGVSTSWIPITNSGSVQSSSTAGGNSDTTTTTSVAAQETSSSQSSGLGSKTTKGSNPAQTDSAPFTDTNNSGAGRTLDGPRIGVWMGLLVAVCWVWI